MNADMIESEADTYIPDPPTALNDAMDRLRSDPRYGLPSVTMVHLLQRAEAVGKTNYRFFRSALTALAISVVINAVLLAAIIVILGG